MLALTLLTLLGCNGDDEAPCDFGDAPSEPLISPSNEALLRVPWVPLMLNVPDAYGGAEVEVCLDGRPWSDPFAELALRYSWLGDGVDYVATLDLRGLDPGPHTVEVRVSAQGEDAVHARSAFTVDRPPHRLTLRVADGRAARVIVFKDGAALPLAGPDAAAFDPEGRDHGLHSVFVLGEATLDVDPGRYTLIAVRSVLDEVDVVEVEVSEDLTIELAVPQVVEAAGWLTADLHVHTALSGDAFLPTALRWQSLAAAGLSVGVLTDHNRVSRRAAPLHTLMQEEEAGGPRAIEGVEASLYFPDDDDDGDRESIGHMNAFPVQDGDLPSTTLTTVAEHLALWRARQQQDPPEGQGELILQLNHPRGIHFLDEEDPSRIHDLFGKMGFDRGALIGAGANAWMLDGSAGLLSDALDFDAIEVLNRASWPLYKQVRLDWFALLQQGRTLTATGNSDSHALEAELTGFPVTLVACPAPGLGEDLDLGCFIDALQQGRVGVSTGPVVSLEVGGAGPGELAVGSEARVRVQAASWVPVEELRLVVNGEVVERLALSDADRGDDGVLDYSVTLALPAAAGDAWVVAEAGRGLDAAMDVEALGLYARIAPDYSPIGFTNPVFLDGDGDGVWTAPGLP